MGFHSYLVHPVTRREGPYNGPSCDLLATQTHAERSTQSHLGPTRDAEMRVNSANVTIRFVT